MTRSLRAVLRGVVSGSVPIPAIAVLVAVPVLALPASGVDDTPTQAVDVAPSTSRVGPPAAPVATPAPTPSAAAAGGQQVVAQRPVVADTVEQVQPDLVVRPERGVAPDGLFSVLSVPGIQHLAGAADIELNVQGPAGPEALRILVVDPVAFRPLTPAATAQTKAVWERLVEGELVVRHDVAQRLQLALGGDVTLTAGDGRTVPLRVGAFASNGTPPLADAIVSWETGARLGSTSPNVLVIAAADDVAPEAVGQQVAAAVGGAQVTPVVAPAEQQARMVGAGSARFEPFSYIDHGDGMITIDPAWVRANIVSFEVPIFGGTARCHRAMAHQLVEALREVERAGLAHLIDRGDYGGCWVPRHILFDPSRPISMHAWGLAVDFNVRTNQYGAHPTMDPHIVDIFERWCFEWGGDWSTPDGMHFELACVVQ